jgi:hypothetical protein
MLPVMRALLFLCLAIPVGIGLTETRADHSGRQRRAELSVLLVREFIRIEVQLATADRELIVPYCQQGEAQPELLCFGSTRLERRVKNRWLPVQLRHKETVLGDPPARMRSIPPGSANTFVYTIDKEHFAIARGDQLRLAVSAWNDVRSMESGDQPTALTSAPFECP